MRQINSDIDFFKRPFWALRDLKPFLPNVEAPPEPGAKEVEETWLHGNEISWDKILKGDIPQNKQQQHRHINYIDA
jgi:hypothetical protein